MSPGDCSPLDRKALWTPVYGSAWIAAVILCGVYAFAHVFSRYLLYDDEGYVLISRDRFMAGLRLYDEVYSQYGPFYFLYYGIWHGLLGLPVTHDANRILTAIHWVSAGVFSAAITWRLSAGRFAALFVFCLTVFHEFLLGNEPGHPQEIVLLLVLALGLVSLGTAGPRWPQASWCVCGVAAGLLLCTKINIGVLAWLAWAATTAFLMNGVRTRVFAPLLIAGVLAFPAVLMREHAFSTGWGARYAIVVTASLAAVFAAASRARVNSLGSIRASVAFHLGFGLAVAVSMLFVLLRGSSIAGIVDALWSRPLVFASVFSIPATPISKYGIVASAGGLVAAYLASRVPRWSAANRDRFFNVLDVLKVVLAVVFFTLTLAHSYERLLAYFAPFVWLLLIGPEFRSQAAIRPERLFFVLIVAFQFLHAYPVFGTHLTIATVLMLPLFAAVLTDALPTLIGLAGRTRLYAARNMAYAGTVAGFALWMNVYGAWNTYRASLPLDLPGASLVRLDATTTGELRWMAKTVEAKADMFISLPGINSLYFWTELRPPTGFNAGSWMYLLSDAEQQAVVDALRKYDRLGALYCEHGVLFWQGGRPLARTPLVAFIQDEFVPAETHGRYTYLVRKGH